MPAEKRASVTDWWERRKPDELQLKGAAAQPADNLALPIRTYDVDELESWSDIVAGSATECRSHITQ